MKFLLLAGTLGAVMLLAIVPSVSNDAFANIFLIDNFSDNDVLKLCDFTLRGPGPIPFDSGISPLMNQFLGVGSEVIDDKRQCQLQLTLSNNPSEGEMQIAEFAGMFRQMAGTGVKTNSYLQYDGLNATDLIPLNLDLSNSDKVRIQHSFTDAFINVTATLIDGDGDEASLEGIFEKDVGVLTNLDFPLTDFEAENVLLDLNDIDELNFNFTTFTVAGDFDVELIEITMVMVGGEMYPTDTTALLLAGAELNAIWILPAVAAIGIGAFIVTRKRK